MSAVTVGGGVSNPRRVESKLSSQTRKTSAKNANRSSSHAEFSGRRTKIPKPFKSSSSSMFCYCCNELRADGRIRDSGKSEGEKWDLQNFGPKQWRAAAATVGDLIRKIQVGLQNRREKWQEYLNGLYAECLWDRWQEYFELVEKQEEMVSIIKLHLEDAVKHEDFEKAARLKRLIEERMAYDTASEVMDQLKKAVEEERYKDAAKLRDVTCAGLVGWWAGLADNGNDPYGRIIRISPEYGRFVAKSYNARQLAAAGPGVPLFEIFISKDSNQEYEQQAVYLQRNGQTAHGSLSGSAKATEESETDTEKIDDAELGDEGLKRVLKFLRAGIPGLKFKVLKVAIPDQADTDIISGVFDQLFQDINKEKDKSDLQKDKVTVGGINDILELIEIAAAKLAFGTLLQSIAEDAPPNVPIRVPAKLEKRDRDTFCFHIEDEGNRHSARGKELIPSWKVATIAKQTSADPMSSDVPKVPWINDKDPAKALQDFGEIITLAVTEARKRRGLHGNTVFHRINIEATNADPFCGLYIGTFGPYPPEVIQLRRRFGQWKDDEATPRAGSKLEFFEYVEAVKLTGDMIIPAGQVTFRAKIGKENQLSHRDIFPEELGVVARYKGQERRAQSGFRNREWTDAELLLLDGKNERQCLYVETTQKMAVLLD
uniref:TSA: Wollemia nobilis Ref_Wollemi_Transcript_7645_2142 transcribed RNA sequence n=1 Tax=Wollemia nobilis TaxID=56998 RepID=A0A0C9S9J0_9CONI